MYMNDHDDRMPDRRDLKALDYRPWTSWPPSDPRGGWAVAVLKPYQTDDIFTCPSAKAVFKNDSHVVQVSGGEVVNYWLWRFDRTTDPVQLDNFWGKSPEQALSDLQIANNPQVGNPQGVAEVELAVDPYFPSTIPTVPVELRGKTSHGDGRNRLFLDGHAKRLSDARTRR